MKKAEALALQKQTVEEIDEQDSKANAALVAERNSIIEMVLPDKDYDPEELRKMIPWGPYLRNLVTEQYMG